MLKTIKSYMMPIAMTLGVIFHNQVGLIVTGKQEIGRAHV